MAKDYAKNHKGRKSNTKKSTSRNKNKPSISRKLWIVTGLLIALFIVGINFLKNEKNLLQNIADEKLKVEKVAKNDKKEKPQKPRVKPITTAEQNQPKFDFYNELPKMKVWVPPKDEQSAPVTKPPIIPSPSANENSNSMEQSPTTATTAETQVTSGDKTKAAANASSNYYLQVAAYKNFADADSLKATLTLQGYDVSIKSQKSVNRVYIGPYANMSEANKVQADLASQKIHSIVVKQNT